MELTVRLDQRIADLPREAWSVLTSSHHTPILEWAWLNLLESSGSIAPRHGWEARHLTLWRGSDLVAGAPLYKKSHSWGEFVYDFAFAEFAQRHGGRWYPKLVGMSPATPSIGWQVLTAPGEDAQALTARWLEEAVKLALAEQAASLQFNFTDPAWAQSVLKQNSDWHHWSHQSFLWNNRGLTSFEDYLGSFDKNQRRNIRREIEGFERQGYRTEVIEGPDIPQDWFSLMGALYDKTNAQFGPWAARFLEPEFFEGLDALRPFLLFAATFRDHDPQPQALSFLLHNHQRLIGRYWGEVEHVDLQYFNVCYYTPIRWAIEHGISAFDPGAGSPLKVRRGFESEIHYSLHRFFDPASEALFRLYIDEVNRDEERQIQELNESVPFRQGGIWKPSEGKTSSKEPRS